MSPSACMVSLKETWSVMFTTTSAINRQSSTLQSVKVVCCFLFITHFQLHHTAITKFKLWCFNSRLNDISFLFYPFLGAICVALIVQTCVIVLLIVLIVLLGIKLFNGTKPTVDTNGEKKCSTLTFLFSHTDTLNLFSFR